MSTQGVVGGLNASQMAYLCFFVNVFVRQITEEQLHLLDDAARCKRRQRLIFS